MERPRRTPALRPAQPVATDDAIELSGADHYVSRAAHKLVGALKRAENEDYYDRNTSFNPFTLKA